jgi:hypothetical protein
VHTGGDQSNGGSNRPRQGFDGFDEVLTTRSSVNRLLVVEARSCRKCGTHRKYSRSNRCLLDRFRTGGDGEPMAMCMHTMKVGACSNVCFLPLPGSTPKSQRQDS